MSSQTTSTTNTAKEAIAANIALLIQQIEAGHSEGLTAYLTAMGRFHTYSFGNVMEIARQRPDATRVAGFGTWLQMRRYVRKGEKGIRILAPMVTNNRKKDTDAKAQPDTNKPRLMGFRAVYVFDVSQTEGEELPGLQDRVQGEVGAYRDRLIAFVAAQGIELEFKESIAPALGMSYGGRIALLPGQEAPEEFATLIHELAHEMLHKNSRRKETTKTIRETEAEAVAFVVCQTVGLSAGNTSADYIHLYNGDAAVLTESLEFIQKTSAAVLAAIQQSAPEELAKAS
jgi:antirestriction protein ArdC